ncbi:SIS domain-containing protein, partial [Micromonospora sp. NPDC126480]|uniref:D-sedoheptulose-7-phosphate isomerase n=1 Tax=Micromonospora sp. NPDC126480 TaxID=3155312 RepID=UPI0033260292
MSGRSLLDSHLANLAAALVPYRRCEERLARWGETLARRFVEGGRLLVAGNGGSAAEAQHLTAELVGKLRHDRQPLSAIALHAETSALTAIANDYGYDHVYARQVHAHGRPGDILLLL